MTSQAALKARLQKKPAKPTGWNPEGPKGTRWIESLDHAGLRLVSYADEVRRARIDHKGWFADEFGDSVLRGVVLQLPARKGRPIYLAGYADPENAGAYRVDTSTLWEGPLGGENRDESEELRDAARAADQFAQREAESEWEYQEAWQLGSHYAQLKDDESTTRTRIIELCREIRLARRDRSLRDIPNVCATLRATVKGLLSDLYKWREERAKILRENYFRGDLLSAFNDGAGLDNG